MIRTLLSILRGIFRPALDIASGLGGIESFILGRQVPQPNYYLPQYTQTADVDWQKAMQAIQAATDRNTGMVDPAMLQSFSQMMGIDLTPFVDAGKMAGAAYGSLAQQAGGMGAQIQQTAFDPQSQLHDYLRQQVTEGSRAADTARGLAMSPYSAGGESDALRKFEMDWQNQQLGRQTQGAGTAAELYGMVPGATMAAGTAPLQAQTYAAGAPMQYAQQFLGGQQQAMQPYYGIQQAAGGYLWPAMGAAETQYGQQLDAFGQRAGLMMGGFNMLGKSGLLNPATYLGAGGGASPGAGSGVPSAGVG